MTDYVYQFCKLNPSGHFTMEMVRDGLISPSFFNDILETEYLVAPGQGAPIVPG